MAASFCRKSFLNYKNCLFQTPRRTGYVVLIPETPEDFADLSNDSLENLPDFSKLNEYSCKQIVTKLSQQFDLGFWELKEHFRDLNAKDVNIFKHLVEPLEVLGVPYITSWGVARTLHCANSKQMPHSTIAPLAQRLQNARFNKYNEKVIYEFCKKALANKDGNYTEEEKRILNKYVMEGFMVGLDIDKSKVKQFNTIQEKQHARKSEYSQRFTTAKTLFRHVITDVKFAEGTPLDLLRNTCVQTKDIKTGPWVVTLHRAIYERYLEYCSDREARIHYWSSFNQLGSVRGDQRCVLSPTVEKLRDCRQDLASIFGYANYAELSQRNKMAGTYEKVQEVLTDLVEAAKPSHETELHELEKFAHARNQRQQLEMWDYYYWRRFYLAETYGLDDLALANYFPLSQVLLGLVALCEQLFGIEIEEVPSVQSWHSDVQYFRVLDEKTKKLLGGFYFDPYSRSNKLLGEVDDGWFVPMRPKSVACNTVPLSALIFSFNPPESDKPSLLYPRNVIHLFEKFGQMLQHTLCETKYSETSGSANIEWDILGVPSNFLRLWLTERGTLESISGHYDTGEPLPSQLLDNTCNLDRYMGGTNLCHDIYMSNLDLTIHAKPGMSCMEIAQDLWPKHLLFSLVDVDMHPYGFSEIFSGPWGASYYGKVWSRMLAADIFAAFEEVGFEKHEEISKLGRRFRSSFLAPGGGCDPNETFRKFRGRDPETKHLKNSLKLRNVKPIKVNASPDTQPKTA